MLVAMDSPLITDPRPVSLQLAAVTARQIHSGNVRGRNLSGFSRPDLPIPGDTNLRSGYMERAKEVHIDHAGHSKSSLVRNSVHQWNFLDAILFPSSC